MGAIHFNIRDAEVLYSFPKPATDLKTIVWLFTFINRSNPPSFDELTSCLTKGLRAGVICQEGEQFVIDVGWYDKIHMADATAANEIESMLEFEDWFVNPTFNETTDAACSLTKNNTNPSLRTCTDPVFEA